MIGPEIFSSERNGKQLQWPNLTTFKLHYKAATPAGEWLFDRDPRWIQPSPPNSPPYPGSDNEWNEEYETPLEDWREALFRSHPLPALNDLYLAAGRAACHMPKLESMLLEGDVSNDRGLDHVVDDSSVAKHEFEYDRSCGRATWVSTSAFHVTDEIREVWNAVARFHGHDEAKISVRLT
ncbi:hypothetical protein N7468_006118 [Penicillium chermesinum]|uniref:DUF6546 domain-containing protein n=1 Tax=Penicillium chermesinum TaxID=63820 RepID=A0A9W9P0L0_9EURO|nr:uncharacterized protein N7468_006118 [Penicillium chermesinum]KAJ5233162.1 hypothetical protein N7468_006118 [Penicillium chermesinum]KAJ6172798.1 hypothetical protein N7470_001865 [Penicillium chermesinum]